VDISVSGLRDDAGVSLSEKCSLQEAFVQWLNDREKSAFEESTAYSIREYYLEGSRLPKGMTPEQKAALKSNARNEGERL
jgi:hypothetical protein